MKTITGYKHSSLLAQGTSDEVKEFCDTDTWRLDVPRSPRLETPSPTLSSRLERENRLLDLMQQVLYHLAAAANHGTEHFEECK